MKQSLRNMRRVNCQVIAGTMMLALSVSLTGCATKMANHMAQSNQWQQGYQPVPQPAPAYPMPHQMGSGRSAMAMAPQQPAATSAPSMIQQTAYFTPAEPRQEFVPIDGQEYPTMEVVSSDSDVYRYPDEYLFDGGDRGMKVHYNSGTRLGVETEDTFAEYIDHTGEQHVRPSNPVAVYAPRFVAVKTITGPEQDTNVDRLAQATDVNPGASFSSRMTLATSNRRSKASGMRTRERGSELDTVDAGIAMSAKEKAAGNVFVLKPIKRSQVQAGMQFERANEAWLANRIQKAADWSLKSFPIIQAVNAAAMEVEASVKPQVHIGIDDESTKGHLRIIKMVDVETAVPGDILTFTIEFQNIGDKDLYNIRIVDNLTPRLEFIENSGASDRKGKIVVDDNFEGSQMLTFELQGKLEGKAKGTVEFKARVL